MKTILVLILATTLAGSTAAVRIVPPLTPAQAGKGSPEQLAETTALSESHVRELLSMLKQEARRIHDTRMREDALKVLDRPEFTVVAARKGTENEIVANLKAEGLFDDASGAPLFPAHAPMAFVAAPGSSWTGHHAYPAGLVYHTITNLRIGLGIVSAYRDVYRIELNEDFIRLGAIWHDSAKTMTMTWNADGSANPAEIEIAHTTGHHIWGIAEALHRGYQTWQNTWTPSAERSLTVGRLATELSLSYGRQTLRPSETRDDDYCASRRKSAPRETDALPKATKRRAR